MPTIKGRLYEPDRIWSSARSEHLIIPEDYPTQESFEQAIHQAFRKDKYLGNLGSDGRQQVIDRAMQDYQMVAPERKLEALLVMRERGMLTRSEYQALAYEMGYTGNQAEYQYQKWSGTEGAIWAMKWRNVLYRGEYQKLLAAKGLTRHAGFYRYRKWQAEENIRPFRNIKPRERRGLVRG